MDAPLRYLVMHSSVTDWDLLTDCWDSAACFFCAMLRMVIIIGLKVDKIHRCPRPTPLSIVSLGVYIFRSKASPITHTEREKCSPLAAEKIKNMQQRTCVRPAEWFIAQKCTNGDKKNQRCWMEVYIFAALETPLHSFDLVLRFLCHVSLLASRLVHDKISDCENFVGFWINLVRKLL